MFLVLANFNSKVDAVRNARCAAMLACDASSTYAYK